MERDPDRHEAALIEERRGPLIESIIEESEDDTLLDRYLEGEEIDTETVIDDLKAAVATARSSRWSRSHPPTGVGVEELLELSSSRASRRRLERAAARPSYTPGRRRAAAT